MASRQNHHTLRVHIDGQRTGGSHREGSHAGILIFADAATAISTNVAIPGCLSRYLKFAMYVLNRPQR